MFGRKKHVEADMTVRLAGQGSQVVRKVPEIITCAYTEQGKRKYQQDAIYVSPGKKLAANHKTRVMAAVCDGMGGMTDGGLASSTAIEMLARGFEQIKNEENIDIPTFFIQGIHAMDSKISSFPKEGGRGSGTTMVAVIAEDNRLYWASVGDSRIYILRGREMIQVTNDHNYEYRLKELVANGQISQEEADAKGQKEALISFLGMGNVTLMDVNKVPFEMQYGDIILLCSDGVTKTLKDDRILAIIQNDAVSIQKKAETLVKAATRENTVTQDNTSVALLQYVETVISKER